MFKHSSSYSEIVINEARDRKRKDKQRGEVSLYGNLQPAAVLRDASLVGIIHGQN